MDLSDSALNRKKFVSKYASKSKNTRKIAFCIWVFVLSTIFLTTLISFIFFQNSKQQLTEESLSIASQSQSIGDQTFFTNESADGTVAFATGQSHSSLSTSIQSQDKMSIVIENFLVRHGSPMIGLGSFMVSEGNRIGVDPALFVSISGIESSFCKFVPINNGVSTHNCHGWGRHGKYFNSYSSWKEEITKVMTGFKNGYGGKNVSVRGIQNTYCPDCSVSTKWSDSVLFYINEIKQMYKSI